MSLIVSFLLASSLLYTLSFSNTAIPWFGLSVVIVMIGGGILMGLGFVLLWVGERISPPDPWLDSWITPWRSYKESKTRRELIRAEEDAIRATVVTDKNWGQHLEIKGDCFVEFEGGHLYLGQPGKDLELVEPKKILRTNDTTLQIDTGRWNYGKVTLTFDSPIDADKVQQRAMKR
jgi:hypothetical protein